jgi:hypothetical protein
MWTVVEYGVSAQLSVRPLVLVYGQRRMLQVVVAEHVRRRYRVSLARVYVL